MSHAMGADAMASLCLSFVFWSFTHCFEIAPFLDSSRTLPTPYHHDPPLITGLRRSTERHHYDLNHIRLHSIDVIIMS
jgi:hypothetical protein